MELTKDVLVQLMRETLLQHEDGEVRRAAVAELAHAFGFTVSEATSEESIAAAAAELGVELPPRKPADPPALTAALTRELVDIRDRAAELVGLDRYRITTPSSFRDHHEEIAHTRGVGLLQAASAPIVGRDGWRRTADGREWYSDAWLGLVQ